MSETYPREMKGYGRNWPHPRWPNDARIAMQFVINYEEGAECPRMMQIGLHNRLVGRPGRIGHLKRFVDHVLEHDRVRIDCP